jgi:hypothetical protein
MAQGAPDRKPRIQGKIANLPPAQQRQIRAWMHEGLSYKKIAKRALDLYGVSIAESSLSNYYSKHQREIISEAAGALEVTPGEPLHATLILHIQIRPELLPAAASNGN